MVGKAWNEMVDPSSKGIVDPFASGVVKGGARPTGAGDLLQVKGLTVEFTGRTHGRKTVFKAVDNADLNVGLGEIVGLVGESGSGKSTISRTVVGLNADYSGSIVFDGRELGHKRTREQWREIQMVFQDPFASLDPRLTVRKMLAEVIRYHKVVLSTQIDAYCGNLMDLVELPRELLDALPGEMSGGQRQRVAIARALAVRPWLLIADEATAALDVSVQAGIINLLMDLNKRLDLSILFITHDLNIVRSICSRTYVIYHGKLVENGPTGRVFDHPANEYTKRLVGAIPKLSSRYVDRLVAERANGIGGNTQAVTANVAGEGSEERS